MAASYSYRFDLVRFSYKIFAIEAARSELTPGEAFAWIDADVLCLKPFSAADLEPFMPGPDQIMSYLGRSRFPPNAPYSECGFLGFNPRHPLLDAFLDRMMAIYATGEAFSFQEWHDSWLWDAVRKEFQATGAAFKNISGVHEVLEHPFVNCGLGTYFDHLKGPGRKKAGRSAADDYVAGRQG